MAAVGEKRISQHLNFVHNDQIWKDHVRRELTSYLQTWPERWGYLAQEYESMQRVIEGRSPLPPMTDWRQMGVFGGVRLPPLGQRPTRSPGFPETTSQEIGWKSTNVSNQLRFYEKAFNTKSVDKPKFVALKLRPIDSAD